LTRGCPIIVDGASLATIAPVLFASTVLVPTPVSKVPANDCDHTSPPEASTARSPLALRPELWVPRVVFTTSKVQAHGLLTISLGGLFLYALAPFLRNLENKALAPICGALGVLFAWVGFFLALKA
jgi:hypothetical protein